MGMGGSDKSIEPITRRERDVLQLLSEGLTDQEIATRLFLSLGTVKWHTKNIYAKFGVERRTQAVKRAREQGLLDVSHPTMELIETKLPVDTTSFVDRRAETEHLLRLLAKPDCRLITLIGVGGVGKTRLAIQAARLAPAHFHDGKVFVSLVGVSSAQNLASTMATALGFPFYGAEPPDVQFLRFLSRKVLLMVIDNYEHLMPDVKLLADLMEQAPGIKLLVTSRERLNLREEWVFQVGGLTLAEEQRDDADAQTDASTLFVQRASQINPRFGQAGMDMPFVQEVCRQVEGIPLAIELAAGWARSLTAKEIASEIGRSFQLLTTALHNVPERHRSMQIVFEQTWARMNEREQRVIEALSVFRGGFTREAAEQVAGADLRLLTTLHDKSLITQQGTGRYAMHELLRQFAEAKLADHPERRSEVQEEHSRYFVQWLWENRIAIMDRRQSVTLATLNVDFANIRQAWQRVVSRKDWSALDLAWESVHMYCHLTAHYYDATALFALILDQTAAPLESKTEQRIRSSALTQTGFAFFMTNRVAEGLTLIEEALKIINAGNIDDERLLIHAFHTKACLLWAKGDYESAIQQCHFYQQIVNRRDEQYYHELAHFDFGITYLGMGELEKARTHFNALSAYSTALGLAWASNFLGIISEMTDNIQEAETLFAKSLAIFRQIEQPWGILMSAINLGRVTSRNGSLREGTACLYEALDLALEVQTPQTILGALVEIAHFFPAIGQLRQGIMILEFLQTNPAVWTEYHARIEPYLAELRLRAQSDGEPANEAVAQYTTMTQVIERVQVARVQFQAIT